MLYHLLIAVGSLVALAGGWVAVQALVRRQSPEFQRGSDVLACHMCGDGGMCHCGVKAERAGEAQQWQGVVVDDKVEKNGAGPEAGQMGNRGEECNDHEESDVSTRSSM